MAAVTVMQTCIEHEEIIAVKFWFILQKLDFLQTQLFGFCEGNGDCTYSSKMFMHLFIYMLGFTDSEIFL